MLNQTVKQWDLMFQIFQIKDERLPSHSVCTADQSLGWKLQTL